MASEGHIQSHDSNSGRQTCWTAESRLVVLNAVWDNMNSPSPALLPIPLLWLSCNVHKYEITGAGPSHDRFQDAPFPAPRPQGKSWWWWRGPLPYPAHEIKCPTHECRNSCWASTCGSSLDPNLSLPTPLPSMTQILSPLRGILQHLALLVKASITFFCAHLMWAWKYTTEREWQALEKK
jgi:hypothetical protein